MNPFRKKPMHDAMHDAPQDDPHQSTPEVDPEGVPDAQPEDVDAAQSDEGEPADADPAAEVEHLRAELAGFREKFARVQADFQNSTRRMEKDNEQRLGLKVGGVIKELLPVLDNLERAQQVDPDAPASAVLDGVKGTHAEFLKVLEKHGVEKLEPAAGDEFDPERHEALMRQPSAEHPAGTVTQTYQPGYLLAGKLVRPAQVVVSQGEA